MNSSSVRQIIALIDAFADAEDADPAIVRAARALRQLPPGRPPIDDAAALAEAERLVETGAAKSRRAAMMRVAKAVSPYGNPQSVYERLRRKSTNVKNCATK